MLARLQQILTLGVVALTGAWVAWALAQDRPGWALAGVIVAATGHAGVLAVEFALLRMAHGTDRAPRASAAQLLRAWWGEALAAPRVFCWRQPFRSRRHPDHLPDDARGRRGVLLVHGFVCNRGLWMPWIERLTEAGVPVVAVDLEPVFGSIDDYVEPIERAMQRLEAATGVAPVVVGHSMGGLALRRWWCERGDAARVHRAITIGTPHRGTWLARFALTPNARQMRLASNWLRTLASREPADLAQHFTCFYGHCDNIVFPPSTATLDGADNRHLPGVAHVHMAEHPEPWRELLRQLDLPDVPLRR